MPSCPIQPPVWVCRQSPKCWRHETSILHKIEKSRFMKKVFFSKAKNERKRRKSLPFSDEQLLSALSQMHWTLSRMWIGYLISHFRHQFQMPRIQPRPPCSPCLQTHHTHQAHHHYNSLTIFECKSKQCVFVRDARIVRDVREVRDVRVGAILPNKSNAPWCAVVRRHAP